MTNLRRATFAAFAIAVAAAVTACGEAPPDAAPADPPPLVSVTVAPVVRMTMRAFVEGWGRVEPEPAAPGRPAGSARVASAVAGVVTGVLGSEGQRVGEGAIVFHLDSRVVDIAVDRARQAVRVAEQLARRQEDLGPGQATSQKAYDEAAAQLSVARTDLSHAELQRALLDVHAPIAGTLVKVGARLGDAIDPTTVLAEIVDLARLVVTASIRSVDVARVRRGQRVEVSLGSEPGVSTSAPTGPVFAGVVEYIGPQVDSATDTVLVRARVPGAAAIRPGQFTNVRIVVEERTGRLAVPVESLVQGSAGSEVAVVEGDTATRTPVTTGLRQGGLVEVQGAGVREGVSVVVQGAYGMPATSKITVSGH